MVRREQTISTSSTLFHTPSSPHSGRPHSQDPISIDTISSTHVVDPVIVIQILSSNGKEHLDSLRFVEKPVRTLLKSTATEVGSLRVVSCELWGT